MQSLSQHTFYQTKKYKEVVIFHKDDTIFTVLKEREEKGKKIDKFMPP